MLDPSSHSKLKSELVIQLENDRAILDQLRLDISPLRSGVRKIQPRGTTSISLVGTDGGNNKLQFDPFLIQLVRVVDSSNNEYSLEAITPTTELSKLARKQFGPNGSPSTPLGHLMQDLGVSKLPDLIGMIGSQEADQVSRSSWINDYREIVEWATLYRIITTQTFATDTLIVFDGLLRSKKFRGTLFRDMMKRIENAIKKHLQEKRRKIFLVGLAKQSQFLNRYRLAMHLEGILTVDYPAYIEVPRQIEQKAYLWSEWAKDDVDPDTGGEANKFVAGSMTLVKFGNRPHDPIWPCDVLTSQTPETQIIMGSLLADAIDGFPVPFYPRCLQKAHEYAALVDFDFDILQTEMFRAMRHVLGDEAVHLDSYQLLDLDPASARYE